MPTKLTGKEKALVFLSTLGDEVSRRILQYLPEKISGRIVQELNAFPKPTPDAIALVMKEVTKISLMAPESSGRLPEPEGQSRKEHEERLRRQAKTLLQMLEKEKPQTVAFFLERCDAELKEAYLDLLSPGRRNDLKRQTMERIPMAERVYQALEQFYSKATAG
jgi:flagellar motor switch protein FliG